MATTASGSGSATLLDLSEGINDFLGAGFGLVGELGEVAGLVVNGPALRLSVQMYYHPNAK